MQGRKTQQLLAVYDVVRRAHDHPSAEQVCQRVRQQMPRVSLGTVYRNLQKLAAQHRVAIVQLPNRTTRYDAVVDAHDHFVCEHCDAVVDLSSRHEAPDNAHLERQGFVVRSHALTFYGLCPSCRSGPRSIGAPRSVRRHTD